MPSPGALISGLMSRSEVVSQLELLAIAMESQLRLPSIRAVVFPPSMPARIASPCARLSAPKGIVVVTLGRKLTSTLL